MQWITLLLIGAALIAWVAYFFTVARMYTNRQMEDRKPGLGAPSTANYPWQDQLANRGSFSWSPSLVGIDHEYPSKDNPDIERESDETIRR